MTVNLKINQTPAVALYSGLSAAGTSMVITPYPVDLDGTKLTMSDFGSLGYCTVDPKISGYEEIISFTGITDNGDGTATLTGLSRDLTSKYPYTTSGTGKQHGSSAVVVFSNNPQIYGRLAGKDNDETITGLWSFTQVISGIVPTASAHLATKGYVDAAATGSATYDQNIVAGVAGEALTSGNVVYLLSSDGKWYVADSATASKSVGVQLGIAQSTVAGGAAINVLIGGLDKKQTGLTAGSTYYLSTTGAISTTRGTNIRLIGRVPNGSTTTIVTDFSGGNPEIALVDGSRTYAVDSGSANAYAITLTPAIAAYKAGQMFVFLASHTNTTASTLAVNGLATKNIFLNGAALTGGEILINSMQVVVYDGTQFNLTSFSGGALTTATGAAKLTDSTLLAGEALTALNAVSAGWYQADGGVKYDAKTGNTGTSSTIGSPTITVGNNSNRIVIVVVMAASQTVGTPTVGGVSCTQVEASAVCSGNMFVGYVLAPVTGSNTLACSFGGSTAFAWVAYSYYNVKQTSTIDNHGFSVAAAASGSKALTPTVSGAFFFGYYAAQANVSTTVPTLAGFGNNALSENGTTAVCAGGDNSYDPTITAITASFSGQSGANGNPAIGGIVLTPATAPSYGYAVQASANNASGYAVPLGSNVRLNFVGFVTNSPSATAAATIQTAGIVTGLSGLTPLKVYYLSDTLGAISATAGTNSRKVGIALSTTTLMITNEP